MALSAFSDKANPPTDADLRATLGKAHGAWLDLIALAFERIGALSQAWGFASASTGWGLRLHHKERILFYMTPREGHFLVSFALGDKAVAAAHAAKLPATLLAAIDAAPRYAEGRGVRIEVKQRRQVPALVTLAQVKQQN